jgi:hypothetical protein
MSVITHLSDRLYRIRYDCVGESESESEGECQDSVGYVLQDLLDYLLEQEKRTPKP